MKHKVLYRVIYYWQGQRHIHLRTPLTQKEAEDLVDEMRADKWRCHYEAEDVYECDERYARMAGDPV